MLFDIKNILALLTTYLVFGGIGYVISKKFKKPPTLITWILLIIGTAMSAYIGIGPNAYLISIFGFNIHINFALQALGIGIILGLMVREIKRRTTLRSNF
jgi:hypothetical protein